MKVSIMLKEDAQVQIFEGVADAFQRGDFYCFFSDGKLYKFPIQNIHHLIEDFSNKPFSALERLMINENKTR